MSRRELLNLTRQRRVLMCVASPPDLVRKLRDAPEAAPKERQGREARKRKARGERC